MLWPWWFHAVVAYCSVLKDQLKSEVLTQKTFTAIVKSFRVAGMQFVLECSVANPSNSLPTYVMVLVGIHNYFCFDLHVYGGPMPTEDLEF